MYFTKKYHPVSKTLIATTVIQILASVIQTVLRWLIREKTGVPDMLDDKVWWMTIAVDGVALVLTATVLVIALRKVKEIMSFVDEEDQVMMGRLQEDTFGKDLSALPADLIFKVLAVWGSILVGVGIIQEVVTILYRRFALNLYGMYFSGNFTKKKMLNSIYNSTHGFKYLALLVAVLLGMVITAILLEDRRLLIFVVVAAGVFLLAFSLFDMTKINVFGKSIGVVWTSVIFHALQTVGMVSFAIYLRVKYKGL